MAPKASDLPEPVKRAVLDAVRDKVGYTEYNRIVDAMGEDAVVDAVLRGMNGEGSSTGSIRAGSGRVEWSQTFWGALGGWGWIFVLNMVVTGIGGIAIAIGFLVLLAVGCSVYCAIKNSSAGDAVTQAFSWILGIAVMAGVLGGLGYGAWKGGPWLLNGMHQWWGWLGQHFRGRV